LDSSVLTKSMERLPALLLKLRWIDRLRRKAWTNRLGRKEKRLRVCIHDGPWPGLSLLMSGERDTHRNLIQVIVVTSG
jgi:hypothetical protein